MEILFAQPLAAKRCKPDTHTCYVAGCFHLCVLILSFWKGYRIHTQKSVGERQTKRNLIFGSIEQKKKKRGNSIGFLWASKINKQEW